MQHGKRSAALRGLGGFWAGFTTPWAGFRYMNRHPALWRHGVLPIVFNLVLTLVLLVAMVYGGVEAVGWLHDRFPPGLGWLLLEILSALALLVVVLGLTLAAWIVFQGILCGYFYSELAREVEIQLGLEPAQMREVPLWYQVTDALLDLGALTAVATGCLVLNFVPVVGSIAAVVVGIYFDCFVFGMDYLDYPQALRARDRRTQRRFARRHRATTLGLGSSVMLVSFVPVLNAVLLTTAAVGAVLLYRRLETEDAAT